MSKIPSYTYLNAKYNQDNGGLNFTDNNFGFTWEIFKELATDVWAAFFTSNCYYRTEPTARNTFKTTVHLIFDIFTAVNFTDTSSNCLRRYDNTHASTTHGKIMEITQLLLEQYNIDFTPNNENKVVWKITQNGGFIKFPSGCVINFTGYTNGSKVMGATVQGSPVFNTWTDEFVDPNEKEPLTDRVLLDRYERLETSILKNQTQKCLNEPIKEWSWTYFDKMLGKEITRYFHKMPFNSFSFNNYDKHHIIYKTFATAFFPLTKKRKELLVQTGNIWYENPEAMAGLGVFVTYMTMKATWDLLKPLMKKQILKIKERDPAEFDTVFYGFEYNDGDTSNFPFKKALRQVKTYNLQDFYYKRMGMYAFNFYSVGVDWATGSDDNTVFKVWGFKEYKNTGLYDPYCICELVVSPNMNLDEDEKNKFYVEEILGLLDNFHNFENVIFHYDDKAKTAISWVRAKLIEEHGIIIKIKTAIKHKSIKNKKAGLADRCVWMRNILSFGNCFMNLEEMSLTEQCYQEVRFSKNDKSVPDPYMMLDPYDADFYAIYPYRNKIRGKWNLNLWKRD